MSDGADTHATRFIRDADRDTPTRAPKIAQYWAQPTRQNGITYACRLSLSGCLILALGPVLDMSLPVEVRQNSALADAYDSICPGTTLKFPREDKLVDVLGFDPEPTGSLSRREPFVDCHEYQPNRLPHRAGHRVLAKPCA